MKNQVINFVKNEITSGNQVIIATMGNGGAGLTLTSNEDLIAELEGMDYVDGIHEAQDIKDFEDYNENEYRVHRFNGENGFYILVATLMDEVQVEVEDVVISKITEDEEYYFIDFGAGVGFYPKKDWTLKKAIEDQKNVWSENV